jgi:O-antigen/teichoic acid export membrane protein
MRTKKLIKNMFFTGVLSIFTLFSGLVIPRIILTNYGSEINGLISSITQFLSYITLIEAGLSGAAVFALYKPLANKNKKEINSIITAAKNFYVKIGYSFILATFVLAIIYPYFINAVSLSDFEIGMLILVLGFNGALEFFSLAKYRALLTADQKTYIVSIASTVHIIVNTFLIILFANLGVSIITLRLLAILSISTRSFILIFYVRKKYNYLNFKVKPNNEALNTKYSVLYLKVLQVVQQGAPVIILTVITGNLKLVSVFAIFNMVILGINSLLNVFKSGLMASFGELIAIDDKKLLQKSYKQFEISYYSLITVVFTTSFWMLMPFIQLYTKGISDIDYYLPIFGFLVILNGLLYNSKTPQGMIIMSAGKFKETRIQTTIQGIILLSSGVILTLFYGIYGVIIGAILSNFYRNLEMQFFVNKYITKLSIIGSFFRLMKPFLLTSLLILPKALISIEVSNYFEWTLYAASIFIITSIITLLYNVIFEDRSIIKLAIVIKNIFKKSTK